MVEIDKMEDGTELVTISRKRFDALLLSERMMDALEAGGVDNWEYYSDALRDAGFYDDEEEEEDDF